MKNHKVKKNQRTRAYLDGILKDAQPGTLLFTNELSIALSTKFRSVNNHNIGNLMRERDDVVLDAPGTWRVK